MKARLVFLFTIAITLLLASIALLTTAIISDKWHHIEVHRKALHRLITTTTTTTTTMSTASTEMANITLPPWYQPNCSMCPTCPPNSTIYVNITWPTTSTTTTTTTESEYYDDPPEYYDDLPIKQKPKPQAIIRGDDMHEQVVYKHRHDHPMIPKLPLRIKEERNKTKSSKNQTDLSNYRFYSRYVGLFRVCFTRTRPEDLDVNCISMRSMRRNTYNTTAAYIRLSTKKLHMLRAVIALLILAVIIAVVIFFALYVSGCVGWSPKMVGILSLLCFLPLALGVAAITLFHFAETAEKKSWELTLRLNTALNYDYAYIFVWVGSGLFLLAAAILNMFAVQIRNDRSDIEDTQLFYYYGYGGAD